MAKVTHGLSGLRTKVRARGVADTIDRRSSGWREMSAFKEALASDLGGAEVLSVQETTLVDLAARTFLLLNHVDGVSRAAEGERNQAGGMPGFVRKWPKKADA